MPAIATPPLVGLAALDPAPAEEAENHRDDAENDAADDSRASAMIAVTNDAMPSPFCGARGGGAYPAYGCGGGGG